MGELQRMEELENVRKEQGRETYFTENVPGDLMIERLCALLRQGIFAGVKSI
ncbi:MAG: hypothetical protein HDQ99_04975 [Lachnospiraceae bacterium]|nr:hypothetical protein [Lachnospiraceae bacterium]